MTRRHAVVPLRFSLVLAAVSVFLLGLVQIGDTGPWPDGKTTQGRVVFVQDRWPSKGGSAWVTYEVNGVGYERWLPDFDEHGHVQVDDAYLLEYRAADPSQARGVEANRDDAGREPVVLGLGLASAALAVVAVSAHFLWREPMDGSTPGPAARHGR